MQRIFGIAILSFGLQFSGLQAFACDSGATSPDCCPVGQQSPCSPMGQGSIDTQLAIVHCCASGSGTAVAQVAATGTADHERIADGLNPPLFIVSSLTPVIVIAASSLPSSPLDSPVKNPRGSTLFLSTGRLRL